MDRYICIHGHFYQPPRENPWLEAIEVQDSSYPYHDWNERITAQCYDPNGASRILDGGGKIAEIVNNYSRISFNFGPTLLAWLKDKSPDTYNAILGADRESLSRFGGHGSAMAQGYNHMILPLANSRDKRSQIIWGIRDFAHRFGREPEGLWLPETAVDLETLDIMAERGLKFTVLSPYQAGRVRKKGTEQWYDATGAKLDPTRVYEQKLPSGRTIALFFYDAPISQGIAFEGLLKNGETFAERLVGAFDEDRDWPQLVHIATDGETYGHHHAMGDMALAYALHYIETNDLAKLTNYGEYLANTQPEWEVEIVENTAWSCIHGVGRWSYNCGCNSGGHAEWNQEWRKPLREALDWLRDDVAPHFEEKARQLGVKDPWAARDDYVNVILDRSDENLDAFIKRNVRRKLKDEDKIVLLQLMEMQRHAMLMYTSCGWFFDELSGIETVQVIEYAGRVVQLAQELFGNGTEEGFLQLLEKAKSNIPEHKDGRVIYEKWVKPAIVDLPKVGAHYAVSSLFETYPEDAPVFAYNVDRLAYQDITSGRAKLATGRIKVISRITKEWADLTFGVVHFGDQNLTGGVCKVEGPDGQAAAPDIRKELRDAFERADLPSVVRLLDEQYAGLTFSLGSLFRDEQRKVLKEILQPALTEAETLFRDIYYRQVPMMRLIKDLNMPQPHGFQAAANVALNSSLRDALAEQELDRGAVESLVEEASRVGARLERVDLGYTLQVALERDAREFCEQPEDLDCLERWQVAAEMARALPIDTDLWETQNIYWSATHNLLPEFRRRAEEGEELAQTWVERFMALGGVLGVEVKDGQ